MAVAECGTESRLLCPSEPWLSRSQVPPALAARARGERGLAGAAAAEVATPVPPAARPLPPLRLPLLLALNACFLLVMRGR